MENIVAGADVFFVQIGAILVFAMHSGFAFLEVGTVRRKNQVNALVKIIVDFGISTLAYFFIGYLIAYGIGFFESAKVLITESPRMYSFANSENSSSEISGLRAT